MEDTYRRTQYFAVENNMLHPMPDIESPIELGPGTYIAKPAEGEGCWMDAIAFTVHYTSMPWEGMRVIE